MDGFSRDADVFLNLAVVNTDSATSDSTFHQINCVFAQELAAVAKTLNIKRFVHVSSVHALDPYNSSAYATSKRDGDEALAALAGRFEIVTLGFVHGMSAGQFPSSLIADGIRALKPTSDIALLIQFLLHENQCDAVQLSARHFLLVDDKNENRPYRFIKRSLDLCAAIAGLVILSWLMALLWCAVKLGSEGPGIFAQRRVGQHGKIFTCYKFRTMTVGTPEVATHDVASGSVTKLGQFLRRTKLDELPQLFNIVRNEMSLIGPRPSLPSQAALISARVSKRILRVKPGISGLAQINGVDMRDPEYLAQWDARAAALRGIIPEFSWLLKTVFTAARPAR